MKTKYLLLTMMAATVMACSEDPVDTTAPVEPQISSSDVPIAFTNPGQEKDDGLLPLSTGDRTTDNLTAMTVYAHYTGADDFDNVTSSTPNFMFAQSVTKDAGAWTYAPLKYWPAQHEKVSFFAIAPGPTATNGITLVDGDAYTGYPSFTVTPPTSPALQEDFCVASTLNLADNTNGGKVPLHFDHVMAKVKFSAKYTSDKDAPFGLVMRELQLTGMYSSSTLHFNASSFTWDTPKDEDKGAYTLAVADNTLVGMPLLKNDDTGDATVSTNDGILMLVPQTVSGAKLELTLWVGDDTEIREITNLPQLVLEAGKSYNYNLTIADNGMSAVLEETEWEFDYTGDFQHFVAPQDGTYTLEAWGAGGTNLTTPSNGGKGAYAAGEINLKRGQVLYIYVGESTTERRATFNGGAPGVGNTGIGGGATDFRLLGGTWSDALSLNARMLVAGGGGGTGYNSIGYGYGGAGGGLTGYDGKPYGSAVGGIGGGQTAGGAGVTAGGYTSSDGSFGKGSNGVSDGNVAGAGGGYYGGSGAARAYGAGASAGGGGGSSFISGMTGCKAINPTATNNPRTQDNNGNTTALNYNSAFGASPTWNNDDEITFNNPSMIDGEGYEWNTGAKAETSTGMPNWNGGGTTTGNTGNGHARITLLTN